MSDVRNPAAVVCQEMLSGIFSTLGRMACLASSFDPQRGRYRHPQLEETLGSDDASEALRIVHELLWSDWMHGSLEQQHADTILYLRDLSTDFERLLALWLESAPFTAFVPQCAAEAERTLFLNNLKLVLQLLRSQYEKPT